MASTVLLSAKLTATKPPERLTKGLARHAVPNMLLARLAGKALPRDGMQRTLRAADIAGIRAFAVHAKDETAKRFYEKFDFIPSPAGPMHLFVLLKDVRRVIAGK